MPEYVLTRHHPSEKNFYVIYSPIKTCPICKHAIRPTLLHHALYTDKSSDNLIFSSLNLCESCYQAFIVTYNTSETNNIVSSSYKNLQAELIYSAPQRYSERAFDERISHISPQFVKIYNQASAAESADLDEIAGLGYRKSLEFLIKDFSKTEFPDKQDIIEKIPLSQCIKNYIDDPRIQLLAERSAWLGNDEAHYIRKQTDRDINDMKNFIDAILNFIVIILITKDAESMVAK